jgi:endonuclease-3
MPDLWKLANTPEKMTSVDLTQLEETLRPINFFKNKALFLKKLSAIILEKFGGEIPKTIDELVTLPGVGRKTANLTLSVVFNEPAICVDTHVHRIMNHIGYVHTTTPEKTELALREKLPKDLWIRTNQILVLVGQNLANHTNINNSDNILNQYELVD